MPTTTLPPTGDERTRSRLTVIGALLVSVFVVLVARLWFVQIVAGERYAALAERNRVRTVTLEAPRGRILDRAGRVLVDNRQVHVIGVDADEMGARRDEVLADLARVLGVDVADIEERMTRGSADPVRPVPIAFDVPERIALFVWEHQAVRFPGVYAELVPRRSYPYGSAAAHVVGYAGEIGPEQLDDPAYAGVEAGAQVGIAGVERGHDRALRGVPGRRELEIDAAGEVVSQVSERPPVPGADVRLTLDLDVQRLAEQALTDGIAAARRRSDPEERGDGRFAAPAGAVVVLDARGGAVRALASSPAFAPGAFVGGIAPAAYAELLDPESHAPLVNRAVQATYPPGSVFKIVSASAALRHRFATPRTEIACPGVWRWGGRGDPFRNWTSQDLGTMTLRESLAQSCDTVFYELAKRMWEAEERRGGDELVGAEARRFGYGEATGIDLPGEQAGVVPGRDWRRRYWEANHDTFCAQAERAADRQDRRLLAELCSPAGARWRGGDAVNLAIGQGDLLATPLQVAVSMAAVASGGEVPAPHVVAGVAPAAGAGADTGAVPRSSGGRAAAGGGTLVDGGAVAGGVAGAAAGGGTVVDGVTGTVPVSERLEIAPEALEVLRRGLEDVTARGGTAADAFAGAAVPVAGKTGTAEAGDDQPYAWFAGYGPSPDPRHVVVVLIEQGGSGSASAAPVARAVFDGLHELGERS